MANIYKKQQVSDYSHHYYSADGNFGQKMMQKAGEYEQEAEKKKAEAQNKYAAYLNLVTQNRFNEFAENPDLMGNPEALKREMNRVRDDMVSGVDDEDVKTAYLANTDKIIGHYTERAANHQRALREREKAAQEAQAKAKAKQMEQLRLARLENLFTLDSGKIRLEYMSDPKGLSDELDNLASDIASSIENDEEKIEFLKKVELKKQSLITNAQNNAINAFENDRSVAEVENLEAATDEMTLIVENIWNGNFDDADLINLEEAKAKFNKALNATAYDGKHLFSEAEILKAKQKADDAMVRGFKTYYNNLDPAKQREVSEYVKQSKGGIKLPNVHFNYADSNVINQMKDYVRDYANVQKANQERFNYEESVKQYDSEIKLNDELENLPPIDALRLLADNQAKVSKKYYDAKLKQLNINAGIRNKTEAGVYGKLVEQIEKINAFDGSAEEIINATNTALDNIEEAYGQNKLRKDDKQNLIETLNSIRSENLPELIKDKSGFWNYFKYNYNDAKAAFKKVLSDESNIDEAMLEYHRTLVKNPKLSTDEKRALVRTIAVNYNNKALDQAVTYRKVANKDDNVIDWQVYFGSK